MQKIISQSSIIDTDLEVLIQQLWKLKHQNFRFHFTTVCPTPTTSKRFAAFAKDELGVWDILGMSFDNFINIFSEEYNKCVVNNSLPKNFLALILKGVHVQKRRKGEKFAEYSRFEKIIKALTTNVDMATIALKMQGRNKEEIRKELSKQTDKLSQLFNQKIVNEEQNLISFTKNLNYKDLLETFLQGVREKNIKAFSWRVIADIFKINLFHYKFNPDLQQYTYEIICSGYAKSIYVLEKDNKLFQIIPTESFNIEPIWKRIQLAKQIEEIDITELKKFILLQDNNMELSEYCHIDKIPADIKNLIISFLLPNESDLFDKKSYLSLSALSQTSNNFYKTIHKNSLFWGEILFKIYALKYGIHLKIDLAKEYRWPCITELTTLDHSISSEVLKKVESLIPNAYLSLMLARYYCQRLFKQINGNLNYLAGLNCDIKYKEDFKAFLTYTLEAIEHDNKSAWFLLYALLLTTDSIPGVQNTLYKKHVTFSESIKRTISKHFEIGNEELLHFFYEKCLNLITEGLELEVINSIKETSGQEINTWFFAFGLKNFDNVRKVFIKFCQRKGNLSIDLDTLNLFFTTPNLDRLLTTLSLNTIECLSSTPIGKEFLRFCVTDKTLTDDQKATLSVIILRLNGQILNITIPEVSQLLFQERGIALERSCSTNTLNALLSCGGFELRKDRIQLISHVFAFNPSMSLQILPICPLLSAHDIANIILNEEFKQILNKAKELADIFGFAVNREIVDLADLAYLSNSLELMTILKNNRWLLKKFSLKEICYLYSKKILTDENLKDIKIMMPKTEIHGLPIDNNRQIKWINYLERILQFPRIVELLKLYSRLQTSNNQTYNMLKDFFNNNYLDKLLEQHDLIETLVMTNREILASKNDSTQLEKQLAKIFPSYNFSKLDCNWNIPAIIPVLIYSPKILDAISFSESFKLRWFRYEFLLQLKPGSFNFWSTDEIRRFLMGTHDALTKNLWEKLKDVPELLTITRSFAELNEIISSPLLDAMMKSSHNLTILRHFSFKQIFANRDLTLNKAFWVPFDRVGVKKTKTAHLFDLLFATGTEQFWNQLLIKVSSLIELKDLIEKNETIQLLIALPPEMNAIFLERFNLTQLEKLNSTILNFLAIHSSGILKFVLSLYNYEQLLVITEEEIDTLKCFTKFVNSNIKQLIPDFGNWQKYNELLSQRDQNSITLAKKLLSSQFAFEFINRLSFCTKLDPYEILTLLMKEAFFHELMRSNDSKNVFIDSSGPDSMNNTMKFYRIAQSTNLANNMTLLQWLLSTTNSKAAEFLLRLDQELLNDKNFLEIITNCNPTNYVLKCFSDEEIIELYLRKDSVSGESFLKILLAEGTDDEYSNIIAHFGSDAKEYILSDLKKECPRLPAVLKLAHRNNQDTKATGHKRKLSYFFKSHQNQQEADDDETKSLEAQISPKRGRSS